MAKGKDTRNHPNRGVSRHHFAGGGYVDVLRSPELQRDIDEMRRKKNMEQETWEHDPTVSQSQAEAHQGLVSDILNPKKK